MTDSNPEEAAPRTPDDGKPAAKAGAAAEATGRRKPSGKRGKGIHPPSWGALIFLLPGLLLLGALVVYPIGYSLYRSFFGVQVSEFVGIDNYTEIFSDSNNRKALVNTAIWVLVAPIVVTALGLIFAVLTERVRWGTAFKLVVFMPMAISFLATGIVFRLVYEQDPDKGVANAVAVSIHDTFSSGSAYPGAAPVKSPPPTVLREGAVVTRKSFRVGEVAPMPVAKVKPGDIPGNAAAVKTPAAQPGVLAGMVWAEPEGTTTGVLNVADEGDKGLPGVTVEALQGTKMVAKTTTLPDGSFTFKKLPKIGAFTLRLPEGNFADGGKYPGAGPPTVSSPVADQNGAMVSRGAYQPGQVALLPLAGVKEVPAGAVPAKAPQAKQGDLNGLVWFDFTKGGKGTTNVVDSTEVGLSGIKVEAVDSRGKVAKSATTGKDGSFTLEGLDSGAYTLRMPKSNFAEKYAGIEWLGSTLITPAIIGSYIWIWAGFAMVLIAAGLAAIPRDALEAARVDGATEWQVFRRVTMPLLGPVLVVVFVTLVINVLKVFDLVLIIGAEDRNASVLAYQMYAKLGNDAGGSSAIAIALVLLILPAMIVNIRRFRREQK